MSRTFPALACALALCSPLLDAAAPRPGDIVVVGDNTIVSIDPRTGNHNVVSTDVLSAENGGPALFEGGDLYGNPGLAPDGTLVIVSRRDVNENNTIPSRLIRVNPQTGVQSLIHPADARLGYLLLSCAVAPNGDIYFPDESVEPANIWKADGATGALTLFSNATISSAAGGDSIPDSPLGLLFDREGTLWALMDPTGIARIDIPSGRQTLFSDDRLSARAGGAALWTDMRQFARDAAGHFYVADNNAGNQSPHYGAPDTRIVRVDRATGAESLVSDNAKSVAAGGDALLYRPTAVGVETGGSIVVADGGIRVLRIDPATGAQTLVAYSGALGALNGLIVMPSGGALESSELRQLRLATAGVAGGHVTSSPAGIDCGREYQGDFNLAEPGAPYLPTSAHVECTEFFPQDSVVRLTAHPDANATFGGFRGAGCSGGGLTCDVTLGQARDVTAIFRGKRLTVVPAGTGSGIVTSFLFGFDCGRNVDHQDQCSFEYAAGQGVSVFGAPHHEGSTFSGFSGGGCSGGGEGCALTMSADTTVTATFGGTTPPRRTLTVNTNGAGSGFVVSHPAGIDCGRNLAGHGDCSEAEADGQRMVLAAHAVRGQRFVGFSGGGCAGTDPCGVTLDQAVAVTATFATDGPAQRALTVNIEGNGYVDSAPAGIDCGSAGSGHTRCAQDHDDGTRVKLAAHALPGYRVSGFSGAGCSGAATTCEVTLGQAASVTATFEPALPTVSFSRARRSQLEGGSSTVDLVLSEPSSATAVARLRYTGSATAGADYAAGPATVSFPPGVTRVRLRFTSVQDELVEGREVVLVRIRSASRAVVGETDRFRLGINDD